MNDEKCTMVYFKHFQVLMKSIHYGFLQTFSIIYQFSCGIWILNSRDTLGVGRHCRFKLWKMFFPFERKSFERGKEDCNEVVWMKITKRAY